MQNQERNILNDNTEDNQQFRTIPVPLNRITPLKNNWKQICLTVVNDLKLDIRFNIGQRRIEIRTNKTTPASENIETASLYLSAFAKGFDLKDCHAFLKINNLTIDSFQIENVKQVLQGEHLNRAIGRVAGQGGKVKNTIENSTKTRILLCDKTIHIMGTPGCIKLARDAVCDLILGADSAKVYNRLRIISSRFNAAE